MLIKLEQKIHENRGALLWFAIAIAICLAFAG